MKLTDYLDVEKLNLYLESKVVTVRFHNKLPLAIYTYGRYAVHNNMWDDVTRKCRGLIVNTQTLEIVARPFEKFFNLDTSFAPESQTENLPNSQPVITEKLDGSLGILYRYNGTDYIASKGSFQSAHAKWATEWYRKNVINPQWPEGFTPLFEIIAPSVQRIVVNYDYHALVLLALINNETGEEADYNTLYHWAYLNGLKITNIYAFTMNAVRKSVYQDDADTPRNEEGYVLAWPRVGQPPLRVKVKFEEYCRLHKLITSTSPKVILDMLEADMAGLVEYYINDSTPTFGEFVRQWVNKFEEEGRRIEDKVQEIYQDAVSRFGDDDGVRKQYALFFTQDEYKEYSAILFGMLDGRDLRPYIYKKLRELVRYETPILNDFEG